MPGDLIFEFVSYEFQPRQKRAVFHYATKLADGKTINWAETIIFPEIPKQEIPKKLLESLHIILGVSYWKFHCATTIQLPYQLTKQEADFWNTAYKKGLGEFWYKNGLNPGISPKFQTTSTKSQTISNFKVKISNSRLLVGVGGGKDSIVSGELLKQHGFDVTAFHIETQKPSEVVDNVIKIMDVPSLKIQRFLDPKVYEKHPYNGHIPISAIYAFLGIFSCIAYGYKYFIVSNEHSSNFGNIKYKGLEVNHQWSKSFEFEQLFSDYIKHSISQDVQYFSLLRPFYEIRIAKMFATMEKYFPYFTSCNRTKPEKRWCGNCAKCVFVWAILSPYIAKEKLTSIFNKDLPSDETLQTLFKDITGQGSMKPFDCVGTFQEAQTALKIKNYPAVFKTYPNAVPDQFKFLGMETVQINRAEGIEGTSAVKYLKKYFPKLKIVKEHADITIKTPGVNKNTIKGIYTTPTNLFFSQVKGKSTIVGVTGSKGKSTTSSLICNILKNANKNVKLLGNIGKPMLDEITNKSADYYVLELSSFQLDDIHFSPDIAVLTSLFPEHMDFHGSLKNYYQAKKNIYRFQKTGDHFIDRPKAKKHYQTQLLGEHNQNNIQAAVEVAKILKIPEKILTKAIASFKPLPHRLENLGTFKKITFYDDAISTTPDSTIMAINSLKNIDTIFLGGEDRGYHFAKLEKTIHKHQITNVVLFPDSGKKMLKSKEGLNIFETKSMQEAVKFAYKNTKKGSVCLLSCASPSYSIWKNFEEKGDQFKVFVKKYAKTS